MFPTQPNPSAEPSLFSDPHLVETPEQVDLEFTLAGIGSRFLALALDTLFQTGAFLIAVFLGLNLLWFQSFRDWHVTSIWLTAIAIVLAFTLYYGYFAIFEILWNGQTPGKRIIGIRVIRENGGPLGPAESIARNLMRIVDQMPGFYAIGIVTAICNKQSKRLGDFVAGSIVVRETSIGEIAPSGIPEMVSPSGIPLGGRRLTPEDIHLINAFLIRRSDLSSDVRRQMADDILNRLRPKLNLTDDDIYRREATLELLAHEHRSR